MSNMKMSLPTNVSMSPDSLTWPFVSSRLSETYVYWPGSMSGVFIIQYALQKEKHPLLQILFSVFNPELEGIFRSMVHAKVNSTSSKGNSNGL